MPISPKHNCIFIHIPKTAGSSIEAALGMHGELTHIGINPYINQVSDTSILFGSGLQHLNAIEIKKKITNYNDYFKFSFIRNPWDRFVSTISFGGRLQTPPTLLTKETFINTAHKLYTQFKEDGFSQKHFFQQISFILDDTNISLVDFVGRYESLELDWQYVCKILNVKKTPLEVRMKSRRLDYQNYYTDSLRKMVSEMYREDIEYFGYKF